VPARWVARISGSRFLTPDNGPFSEVSFRSESEAEPACAYRIADLPNLRSRVVPSVPKCAERASI
jgi:hypothetical protein